MINLTKGKESRFSHSNSRRLNKQGLSEGASATIKLGLFVILLTLSKGISAQSIVQLHPVVGDTISNSEKVAFYLFPEITDTCFVRGVILHQDSAFKVSIVEKHKATYDLAIDSTMLQRYQQNIEKLTVYYSQLQMTDSLGQKQALLSDDLSTKKGPEYRLNEEERKQLLRESKRYLRKKDKAEDLGIHGPDQDIYIQGASHSNIFKGKIRF
ncbi:hypothetical protein [Carboxylicivirga sp. N1Y90]|uniref:hypothetical protein n=1 Tax=Carboxylicivirga fragile TaxID=3417571 RepID=UPI003D33DE41|nr:hypothetical protein [Marinilabiliaceae bacterium N1Y90]